MPEEVGTDLALLERCQMDAIHAPRQEPCEARLAHAQRQLADVFSVAHQHIERIELDLLVMLPAVQALKIRSAIDAQQDRFPIDHKRVLPVAQRGFPNQRKPVAPIVPILRPQPHDLAVALSQQSGIPAGRADAFPVELVGSEAPEPVAPDMVEPTVVLGVFSDDDAPASVGFFSRMMLRLISQHCLGVTP